MKRYSTGDPDNAATIAKKAKEFLKKTKVYEEIEPSKEQSGLKNPCVFGKHNPNFDKNINLK